MWDVAFSLEIVKENGIRAIELQFPQGMKVALHIEKT